MFRKIMKGVRNMMIGPFIPSWYRRDQLATIRAVSDLAMVIPTKETTSIIQASERKAKQSILTGSLRYSRTI